MEEDNKFKLNFIEKILLIIFIMITFTGRNIIGTLKWGIIIAFFIIPFADIVLRRKKILISNLTRCWLIIGTYILLGMAYTYDRSTSTVYIGIFLIGALFLIYKININVFQEYIKITKVLCIIFALSNIISVVVTNFIPKYFSFFVTNLDPIYIELAGNNYSGLAGEKAISAVIMNIGIGIIYSQILVNGKFNKKDIISLLILFAGLFLTGKRMLTLIPLFLLFVMYMCSSERNKLIKLAKISSLILVGIVILFIAFPSLTHVLERFIASDDNGREELWASCIEMFKDSPLIGQGLGTFNEYNYDLGYRDYGGTMWTYEAHNIYYQILGELGIIGLLLIICTFIYAIILTIKLLRENNIRNNKKYRFLLYISLYIQLLFLVYGLTGNTFYYWHQLYLYMIALSIINSIMYNIKYDK